ncbi:ethanolamine ammonia-lyase subunit EutC [Hymenobacter tibetensis]|uniref:Ethanolamine ammonia-lyase small subunit n=1 Tax=Hymenobacter tibetensis TaxID=497967 RepID=A0ABY4D3X5_9BACT|nr:ethanolamine ammonia-lyase subunit EutC [Hymenobacter tibetensis]UOG74633.1 ethanolamine ammonia-lyase subunit EutC [Hymenobacter tibetensis]
MAELPASHQPENPAPDPWAALKAHTAARIALGRTGSSVPLREALAFRLAHAHARDAVYSTLDLDPLLAGLAPLQLPVLQVRSKAPDRQEYLQRPDLGRQLHEEAHTLLQESSAQPTDLVIVLADGLSAAAVNEHAVPLVKLLVPILQAAGLHLGPLVVAAQARVALGDEIGALLHTQMVLILIGERPGLSSPDSLGAYFTYGPRPGLTDEARNCVSNIRPAGLPYDVAANRLSYLLLEALRRKLSGVHLKDDTRLLA